MTEQRINEACCAVLKWEHVSVLTESIIASFEGMGFQTRLFTRDDNMARLMRDAVIAADEWDEFVEELGVIVDADPTYGNDEIMRLMQATAAQVIEASLKALGKWESGAE